MFKNITEKYKVVKCLYWNYGIGDVLGYQIEGPEATFYPNMWLHTLKSNTAKQYAYKLCCWLNYIATRDLHYDQATIRNINLFLDNLRFSKNGMYYIGESAASRSTIRSYVNVISGFYTYIQFRRDGFIIPSMEEQKKINKDSFLKDIIWDKTTKKIFIDRKIDSYKPQKKYVKWYSDNEILGLLSNFKTYRDKAIFLVSCDGARIDEILSIKLRDYNSKKGYALAYRSKRRTTGDTGRVIVLSPDTIIMIENYILYERIPLENHILEQGRFMDQELFINLKMHPRYAGKKMSYNNYYNIINRVAKKYNLDGNIRTHSGRSTCVMTQLRFHSQHPDLLSLEDIRIRFGWSNINSMISYVNNSDPEILRDNQKLLSNIKAEIEDKYGIYGKPR